MTQNIIKEENFIKTISEYFEIIPYLRNNKFNNKYYDIKETKSYTQSFYNNLINLYNHNYYYSILNDIVNIKNLNVYSEIEEENLLLNIREKNYETTFKYLFGYKPMNATDEKYYFFKKISPNNVNENEKEYIYTNCSYYENLIIPEELKIISKSKTIHKSVLLNIPLFLKHYKHIFPYCNNCENILNNIKEELKKINCKKYLNMVNELQKVESKKILKENKSEYFYILTAMFLDKTFNNLELDKKTVGYMVYDIIKNKSTCSLNLGLPETVEIKDLNFLKEKVSEIINKTIITKNKKPSNLAEFFGNNYIAVTPQEKQMYKQALDNGFVNLFNGGYSNNIEENKKIIKKINDIETIKDDKIITTQTILPVLKNIQKIILQNPEHLKELLFGHILIEEDFFTSHEFKKDLHKIYELSNKCINLISYDLDDFELNIFSLNSIPDEKKFIQIYMYYFNIIKNICFYIVNNKNSNEIKDYDFIVSQLGLMVLKTIDIIGKLSINDVLAFRYYMEFYYNLLNLINKKMSFVAIIPYINFIIEKYNNDVIRRFLGGDPSVNKIIDFKNFYSFDYFEYTYLFDILSNLKEDTNYQTEFYTPKDNVENLFWDGMCYDSYNKLSNNEKIIKSVVTYTMFINETINGDKMFFKINKNNKIKRVCFLPKRINDKTTVATLLTNLTQQLEKDINYEKNIETFLGDLNVVLKNTDISGLLKILYKIDNPQMALGITSYIKEKKLYENPSNNTFIELLVFVCLFLKKLGFKVNKNYSKTNLKLEIEPKITKENILQFLNEKGTEEFNKKYNQILLDNNDLIDFFLMNSINDIGGTENDNQSLIILALNDNSVLENNISDKILDIYENKQNVNSHENDILEEEEIFLKEKKILNEDISYLLNIDQLTEKNLYRIIPNYIKNQYNIFKNNIFLDEILSNDLKGGDENTHAIDILLEKIKEKKPTCQSSTISPDKLKENINLILNERFIKNLNNNTLLYYDNVLFNSDKNVYKTALYSTIKNFEYLKSVYKIDISKEIKEGLLKLLKEYNSIEQYIYQIFIVSEYIKKFITYMYQKLGIDHDTYNFDYDKFIEFYSILECKFKEKNKNNEKLYNFITKHNLQKLSLTETNNKFSPVNKEEMANLFKKK